MKNLVCFRICGFVIVCGQNRSLGMMDWSLKFGALYVARLKESQSYWLPSLIDCKNIMVVERRLYLIGVWVLGNGIIVRILHIARIRRHLLGKI
jgi:hypothetical protein